jgi:hypothetical protein
MPGMVYNPDFHRRNLKRKNNKFIGLEYLRKSPPLDMPCRENKNQKKQGMKKDPRNERGYDKEPAEDIEKNGQ